MPLTNEQSSVLRRIISESFDWLLARSANCDYIDTKFDVIDGRDYKNEQSASMRFRSQAVIYSWIQGRGLESLAGHWRNGFGSRNAVEELMRTVAQNMERVRQQNNGRMFFMFSPAGKFLNGDLSERHESLPGQANYSDLFYSKGLLAAAAVLQDTAWQQTALTYFRNTLQAIWDLEFVTDQQAFDPKNPVTAVPGKILQGPFMIALGGIALAAELTGGTEFLDYGRKFIERLLTLHTNYTANGPEFFEAVTSSGEPYLDGNGQLCDPGHALEFVGLSMKFLLIMEKFDRNEDREFLQKCRKIYPDFLLHHYALGRQEPVGGIIKSFDLQSRRVINSDMPWWSLPETIRAAALAEKFCNMDNSRIISECCEAFVQKFTNFRQHCFAYQTVDENGLPVRVIPAVPDLDPGYHTNLSLIDVLKLS